MPQFIVFDHNKHEMDDFRNICNDIGLNPTFKSPYIRENSFLKGSGIELYTRNIDNNIDIRKINMKQCKIKSTFVILVDGSCVPCCYDHNGDIVFGNIYDYTVSEICNSHEYIKLTDDINNGCPPDFCLDHCLAF
jgi:hypothetical protein